MGRSFTERVTYESDHIPSTYHRPPLRPKRGVRSPSRPTDLLPRTIPRPEHTTHRVLPCTTWVPRTDRGTRGKGRGLPGLRRTQRGRSRTPDRGPQFVVSGPSASYCRPGVGSPVRGCARDVPSPSKSLLPPIPHPYRPTPSLTGPGSDPNRTHVTVY